MPLTPAHPAVVLPLQRLGLPLSALAAGAVAPDAPVYLPIGVGYETTHSSRGLGVDVLIGLGILLLWSAALRDAVVEATPALRNRLPAHAPLTRRAWVLAPVAVAVGAATHVLWDSTTHDWGFVVREVALLRDERGPLPLYRWLQHGSTVVGSAVVAGYGVRRLRRRPVAARAVAAPWLGRWLAAAPVAALAVGLLLGDPGRAVGAWFAAMVTVGALWRVRGAGSA